MHGNPSAELWRPVAVESDGVTLAGELAMPEGARGVVAFAHGSGSSRFSPRNHYVAGVLQGEGVGTLLFDLLTEPEGEQDARNLQLRFDIGLLARRLGGATDWLRSRPETKDVALGYFGASTGAAAALVAAAERPDDVRAVVSRGGRPDLAAGVLPRVTAPTLLIVGGEDTPVLAMNEGALEKMTATREMIVIPGATHLFEEPGALEEVAELAAAWFVRHLRA